MPDRQVCLKSLLLMLVAFACMGSHSEASLKTDHIPMAARTVLARAGKLMHQKAYDRAIRALTAFQQRGNPVPMPGEPDPKGYGHPMVYFFLGNCHLALKNYHQAQELLSQAVSRDPDFTEAWMNLAKTYFERQKYEQAAQCYLTAYNKSHQNTADSLYFSALGYLMASRYGLAIIAFQKLFDRHPDRITLQWQGHFARALLADGQPRRALPLIRDLAAQSSPQGRTEWQEILLYQYLQLDMQTEALALANELTRRHCTTAKWWKALAQVHLSAGRYPEALTALTIYGFLAPLSIPEKKLRADLYLQLNIPGKAAAQYHEILNDQFDEAVLRNLVLAYERLDQYPEALDLLTHYAPGTENPGLLMLKADLYYALKRYPEAENIYRRVALKKKADAGQAWMMAGYAAWQGEDINAGRRAFEEAVKDSRYRKAARLALQQMGKLK